jgi:putative hydrolase of the HAD superfamily
MMTTIRGVIFDFGSTLIRFRGDWDDVLSQGRRDMAAWLARAGYPIDPQAFAEAVHRAFQANFRERQQDHRERASRQILKETFAELGLPPVSEDDLREALRRLYARSEACWSPVPGAHEALASLHDRGLRLGLLSNASDVENVERLLSNASLLAVFDPVVVSAAAGVRKPTPSLFESILRQWWIEPSQAVMVGDMLGEDILGAQRAGLHQIWVRGEADPAFNAEFSDRVIPEWTVETVREVPGLLESLAPDPSR